MDRGESLIDILAVYSEHTEKLKPLLLVAMLSRALPQPVPGYTALRVGRNQMLAEMASMQAEDSFLKPRPVQPPRERIVDRWIGVLKRLQPAYRFATLSLVMILAGGFFTLSASASGLADNIMQTIFFSFEQVGDLLLVKPSSHKAMGENPILTSEYDLPGSTGNYYGDFKNYLFAESDKGNEGAYLSGNEDHGNQGESGKKNQTSQQGENAGNGPGEEGSQNSEQNSNKGEGQDNGQDENQDNNKDNGNNSDGMKDNDNNKDGEKDNDNNSDGEKDNDNNSDGEKKDKKDKKDK